MEKPAKIARMFQFELPTWINEICIIENYLYSNYKYIDILKIFFDENRTVHRLIEYNKGSKNVIDNNICKIRSTYIEELIDGIDKDPKLKEILKLFLTYKEDINFFHPTPKSCTFVTLKSICELSNHCDLKSFLIRRKELRCPNLMSTICSNRIFKNDDLWYLFNLYEKHTEYPLHQKVLLFKTLFEHYIESGGIPITSNRILKKFLKCCQFKFDEFMIIIDNRSFNNFRYVHPNFLDFFILVDWINVPLFDIDIMKQCVNKMFNSSRLLLYNTHLLFAIYKKLSYIFKGNIYFKIQHQCLQEILDLIIYYPNKYTELIILFECTHQLRNFTWEFLDPELPVIKYLKKRFVNRYMKYIQYWRHMTYRPGSKIFQKLSKKYAPIMM